MNRRYAAILLAPIALVFLSAEDCADDETAARAERAGKASVILKK